MRNQVFISYSHADKKWLAMLEEHLAPYVDGKTVSYWADNKLRAGDDWRTEINQAIAAAKVAVLLVTSKFLKSDFIKNQELPLLLEAAEKEGLKVVWIAVTHNSYQKTKLSVFQAANDPARPLDSLPSWERNKVLVEICQKIEQALQTTPNPQAVLSPKRTRKKNSFAFKRCNRSHHINKFEAFFRSNLKKRPGLPHIYLVHGKIGECHDTLTERLYQEVIRPYADSEPGKSLKNAILRKDKGLGWPHVESNLESLKEELQTMLFREFAPNSHGDFSAAELRGHFSHSKFRFVIIQHTVHLSRWTDLDKALLDWYINTYWASLASLAGQDKDSQLQFLVFLKITYPKPGLLDFITHSFDKESVKQALDEIIERGNQIAPCLMLFELTPPPYTEVFNWFTEHKVLPTEDDRIREAQRIYQTHRDNISMSVIEKELMTRLNP